MVHEDPGARCFVGLFHSVIRHGHGLIARRASLSRHPYILVIGSDTNIQSYGMLSDIAISICRMTVQKINSDKLGIEHVGKYTATHLYYKLPNGVVRESLVMGLLDSVSHSLDYRSAVVTTVEVRIAADEITTSELRGSNVYVADSLPELLIEVAAAAETEAQN